MKYPFIVPDPPQLSASLTDLQDLERSGWYSNYGPLNSKFEQRLINELFNGVGFCCTTANATLALMLAVRQALTKQEVDRAGKYAILPSFTFAATAHAVIWNGLEPLYCDIDPVTWLPLQDSVTRLLDKYGDDVALVLPYATFGNCLDLKFYENLSKTRNIPVVVDAAASLGSADDDGGQFGKGSRFPIIYSMHATKLFSTGEGGLVYCEDRAMVDELRMMGNFGFNADREVETLGLNSKLSEIGALLCLKKLDGFEKVVFKKIKMMQTYQAALPEVSFQEMMGRRQAFQFAPVVIDFFDRLQRDRVIRELAEEGIEARDYFSCHLAKHPYFSKFYRETLPNTSHIADRVICLPMNSAMNDHDIHYISDKFKNILKKVKHEL